ncbi:hypothetical protein FB567DRAFT_526117 [Paraphoma chrysanthemicola]|uniref:Uncharacterized protein n=1 Tax=Paraphoma chrysanthemicola TaxID=798071 RepID=A0A8K0R6C2_9PLEO|nr:hypothetical protein FB567DRAFT_526117 [Paraphoma chrysanthemicola]
MDPYQVDLINSRDANSGAEKALIDALWPMAKDLRFEKHDWIPFSTYYVNQYEHSLQNQGQNIAVRKHGHIIDLCRLLLKNTTREQIRDRLLDGSIGFRASTTQVADNTIDLAARICFMVNVGSSVATITPGRTQLQWRDGEPRTFLRDRFTPQQMLSGVYVRFERTFTARSIDCIAGIRIRWTDNLADHLRMLDPDDKTIAVFHHASFLKRQQNDLFPGGFIEEMRRTLTLLFPQHDRVLQTWLQTQKKQYTIDGQLAENGQLRLDERQLNNFRFWHDRLVILKQAYDESRPATLSQWWHDRRNSVQWYTFWVAIIVLFLTIFFGMVQSIEGALQVYKAYHPTVV